MSEPMDPFRGMALAAAAAALLALEPQPYRPWAPVLGLRSKPRKADPNKKAARKRQKKARAITRRSSR